MPSVITAPVPTGLADPEAWAVHGAARVSRAYELDRWGYADLWYSPAQLLTDLRSDSFAERRTLVALRDGVGGPGEPTPTADDVVGFARVYLPLRDNTHMADIEVYAHPEADDAVSAALLDAAEAYATGQGRTTVMTWTGQVGEPEPGPGVVEPPTGSGRVDTTAPFLRTVAARGYVLEQAERYSVLPLPVADDVLDPHGAEAAARAGEDYELVSWTDRTPDAWVDQLAVLMARMSTDVPLGGLDLQEAAWDAARVGRRDERIAAAGHGYVLTAALHRPTGTLAAFTILEYPRDEPEVVFQEDTLVLAEHRGRRLGMLVKVANLRRLRELRPQGARVHTWNAEENSYMLAINVALGFRRAGVESVWQKRLGA